MTTEKAEPDTLLARVDEIVAVAWLAPDSGACTSDIETSAYWIKHGVKVAPLYAAPARCDAQREALRKARQYVADAGSDEDSETQANSSALLAEIDDLIPPTTKPAQGDALSEGHRHYLSAIRKRLEQLYDASAENPRLREQLSDEVDWVDVQLTRPPSERLSEDATAWAVRRSDGTIFVKTISDTRRAAIVNWLLIEIGIMVYSHHSDAEIEAMWKHHGIYVDCRVVYVRTTQ